jgi:hypothetical protein
MVWEQFFQESQQSKIYRLKTEVEPIFEMSLKLTPTMDNVQNNCFKEYAISSSANLKLQLQGDSFATSYVRWITPNKAPVTHPVPGALLIRNYSVDVRRCAEQLLLGQRERGWCYWGCLFPVHCINSTDDVVLNVIKNCQSWGRRCKALANYYGIQVRYGWNWGKQDKSLDLSH